MDRLAISTESWTESRRRNGFRVKVSSSSHSLKQSGLQSIASGSLIPHFPHQICWIIRRQRFWAADGGMCVWHQRQVWFQRTTGGILLTLVSGDVLQTAVPEGWTLRLSSLPLPSLSLSANLPLYLHFQTNHFISPSCQSQSPVYLL